MKNKYIYSLNEETVDKIIKKTNKIYIKNMGMFGVISEKQLNFNKELCKDILTDWNNKILVNHNRCGLGKSKSVIPMLSILTEIDISESFSIKDKLNLEELEMIESELYTPKEIYNTKHKNKYKAGAIYLTDSLERLKDFCNNELLKNKVGYIDSETLVDCDIQNNATKTESKLKEYYDKPIIAMTTQKYALLTDKEKFMLYNNYKNGSRLLKIFDEKPVNLLINITDINQQYISDCLNRVEREIGNDEPNKKIIVDYLNLIQIKLSNIRLELVKKYDLTYIKKQEYPVFIDQKLDKNFNSAINKLVKNKKISKELKEHLNKIFMLFLQGFVFETGQKSKDNSSHMFIIENMLDKFDIKDTYNVILDATAYFDVDYNINKDLFVLKKYDDNKECDMKFHFINIPTSKQKCNDIEYRNKLLNYLDDNIFTDDMFISSNLYLEPYIRKCKNVNQNNIEHFNNIKGKNNWNNLNKYCQIGHSRKSNSYYVNKYIAINNCIDMFNNMEQKQIDLYINDLVQQNGYHVFSNLKLKENGFNIENNNVYMQNILLSDVVIDANQNLNRIKCRNFSNTDVCDIYFVYNYKNTFIGFIPRLLASLGIENNVSKLKELNLVKEIERPDEFIECKLASERKNLIKGYKEFIEWFSKWNGEPIKVKDIKDICNLNTKQWEKLKKHKDIKNIISNLNSYRKGWYEKIR